MTDDNGKTRIRIFTVPVQVYQEICLMEHSVKTGINNGLILEDNNKD